MTATATLIDRDLVTEALGGAGLDPADVIQTDYSGRGMVGARCLGLALDDARQFAQFAFRLGQVAHAIDEARGSVAAVDAAEALLDAVHQETFGMGVIVYFPGFNLG